MGRPDRRNSRKLSIDTLDVLPEIELREGGPTDEDSLASAVESVETVVTSPIAFESVQPFYLLRAFGNEIAVDLCEVRDQRPQIVRAGYLSAPSPEALLSLLLYCPNYPLASTPTRALRCNAELHEWLRPPFLPHLGDRPRKGGRLPERPSARRGSKPRNPLA